MVWWCIQHKQIHRREKEGEGGGEGEERRKGVRGGRKYIKFIRVYQENTNTNKWIHIHLITQKKFW
jgi:hypothetical protein